MKCIVFLFVFTVSAFFVSNLSAQSVLKAGTQVPVKLTIDASSKGTKTPIAIVAEDIFTSDSTLAIKCDAPVETFYHYNSAEALGEPGKLTLWFESTRTKNSMKVALDCNPIVRKGKNREGLAIGLGAGLGSLVWPCLLCLLIKGKNACIPAGTVISNVFVAEDVSIQN